MTKYLLINGTIIDGSGADGFVGNVLISGCKIEKVSSDPIVCETAKVIDCTGLAIAPGFIDGHSHQDHFFIAKDQKQFFEPFLQQGITTFVCGNCGFGISGFKKNSPFKQEIAKGFLASALANVEITWDTWPEYMRLIEENGMIANMATLAAHGAALGSILGTGTLGADAVTGEVEKEVLDILEEGLKDGCKGISMGLAYRPGNFTTKEQIHHVAELAAKYNKMMTIHREVETSISGKYDDFSEYHNVRWLRELFDNVKDTGVKLHISHLLFAGRTTFPSYDSIHQLIDEYASKGLDVTYDMYSYEYGSTEIALLLSADVPQDMKAMETNKELHDRREEEFKKTGEVIGIFNSDAFLSNPYIPEFEPYKGMFLDEMAKVRGMSEFDNVVDIYKKTDGHATVMLSPYYTTDMIINQMQDSKVNYQTDAWIDPGCAQNPSAYGSYPRFIRLAREHTQMRLEDVIYKMTGKIAERFDLPHRGFLKNGYFADVTVFDPINIHETASAKNPSGQPVGISKVFVNGELIVDDGNFADKKSGMVIY